MIRPRSRRAALCIFLAAALSLALPPTLRPQTPGAAAADMSIPPRQWAADAVKNELNDFEYHGSYLRYRMRVVDAKGDIVRDVIETKDGPVARLVEKNGKPLSADDDKAERSRLNDMLGDPAAFAKHVKSQQTGRSALLDVIRQMPQAMLYNYAAGQPQRSGAEATEIVLDYTPDPAWHPSGIGAQALTGIRGRIWIDPATHSMRRLEATVFQAIDVGYGIFVKVYPGGTLAVEQRPINPRRTFFTRFTQNLTIRAMLVKTIRENSDVSATSVTEVPSMTYQEAIRLLLAQP